MRVQLTADLIDEVLRLNDEYDKGHLDETCPIGVAVAIALDGLAKHVAVNPNFRIVYVEFMNGETIAVSYSHTCIGLNRDPSYPRDCCFPGIIEFPDPPLETLKQAKGQKNQYES